MPAHIRTGDEIVINAGQFKGQAGTVVRVLTDNDRVVVRGPGIPGMVKNIKPSRVSPQGGSVEVDRTFHKSNVSPAVDGKPSRVRFETKPDGSKVRVAVRGGKELGSVRGPRKG